MHKFKIYRISIALAIALLILLLIVPIPERCYYPFAGQGGPEMSIEGYGGVCKLFWQTSGNLEFGHMSIIQLLIGRFERLTVSQGLLIIFIILILLASAATTAFVIRLAVKHPKHEN